ncbi:MAG: type II secretion system protein [Acidobacteria bacterium]|nr:type II secretion system protein [Acidobacteriota bacterium]
MPGAHARLTGQSGYAMAVLLVTLAVMGVVIGVAMPIWRTVIQREKEEELIFRGRQYTRAIGLFQRRFANTYPPSFDMLVEQKFLRKKFKDPMTEDGEFQVLYQGSALALPGGRGSQSGTTGLQTGSGASAFGAGSQGAVIGVASSRQGELPSMMSITGGRGGTGPQVGVIGVASKSTDKSIRILDGRSRYSEWQFIWQPTAAPGRGGGANQPGGRGGRGEQGGFGMPGSGAGPGRGQGGGRQPGSGRQGPGIPPSA